MSYLVGTTTTKMYLFTTPFNEISRFKVILIGDEFKIGVQSLYHDVVKPRTLILSFKDNQ